MYPCDLKGVGIKSNRRSRMKGRRRISGSVIWSNDGDAKEEGKQKKQNYKLNPNEPWNSETLQDQLVSKIKHI
jgi:hypothetical protein